MNIDGEMYETLIERLKVDRIHELVVPLDIQFYKSQCWQHEVQAGRSLDYHDMEQVIYRVKSRQTKSQPSQVIRIEDL